MLVLLIPTPCTCLSPRSKESQVPPVSKPCVFRVCKPDFCGAVVEAPKDDG